MNEDEKLVKEMAAIMPRSEYRDAYFESAARAIINHVTAIVRQDGEEETWWVNVYRDRRGDLETGLRLYRERKEAKATNKVLVDKLGTFPIRIPKPKSERERLIEETREMVPDFVKDAPVRLLLERWLALEGQDAS